MTRSVSSGTMRWRAQFDGFLDDILDDFSLGHGHEQSDGAGRGGVNFSAHGDGDEFLARVLPRRREIAAGAVQHRHEFAAFQTQDVQRVMRLAFLQPQDLAARSVPAADKIGAWAGLTRPAIP
jgi:hypothetical protein